MINLSASIEKLFHEPTRLSILSELCANSEALSFTELKGSCGLTDGNLSRHLSTLEEAGIVKIKKSFVDNKPKTTIEVTSGGRKNFLNYLDALEVVLKNAAKRIKKIEKSEEHSVHSAKLVKKTV